jgi:hypothetical protein
MKKRKILESCPTCSSRLSVTELSCADCGTVIHGHYDPCPFCQLSPKNLTFMMEFVKNRGNVKEMERELGVSYWTIRSKLDEIIKQFGFENPDLKGSELTDARREILEKVDQGKISVDEAAEILATF